MNSSLATILVIAAVYVGVRVLFSLRVNPVTTKVYWRELKKWSSQGDDHVDQFEGINLNVRNSGWTYRLCCEKCSKMVDLEKCGICKGTEFDNGENGFLCQTCGSLHQQNEWICPCGSCNSMRTTVQVKEPNLLLS